ncbi:PI-PLC X domain-containing protein 2 [Balamuthia mandrillaris]
MSANAVRWLGWVVFVVVVVGGFELRHHLAAGRTVATLINDAPLTASKDDAIHFGAEQPRPPLFKHTPHYSNGSVPSSAYWMQQMKKALANMTLSQMVIPGTHDSGAYHLYDQIAPGTPDWLRQLLDYLQREGIFYPESIIRHWAQSQRLDIYQQLLAGVRFLDIRVCWDAASGQFKTLHFLLGNPTEVILQDIARFMEEFKEEVLILQFGDFPGMNADLHNKLIAFIESFLGGYLLPRTTSFADRRYSVMIKQGKRIMAFYDDSVAVANNTNFWFSGEDLLSTWANTDKYPYMHAVETKAVRTQTGNPDAIFKLQWVLTATTDSILNGLVPGAAITSLHDLSRLCNVHLNGFVEEMRQYKINLLMTDFYEETDTLDRARMLNWAQCYDRPDYSQHKCKQLQHNGKCANKKVANELCPLTCQRCRQIKGQPGQNCSSNAECFYGICSPARNICLTDEPRAAGDACGVDNQCWSGKCRNFKCVGQPIGTHCTYNEECGSHNCSAGVCVGTPAFVWSRVCSKSNIKAVCEEDPRGLVFVTTSTCGDSSSCVDGMKVLCSTSVLPYTSYFWKGDAPFCEATPKDCGTATYLLSNYCGDGDFCFFGKKVLCGVL